MYAPTAPRRTTRSPSLLLGCVLGAVAALAASAQTPTSRPAQPYSRVLIIGVTPNFNQRCLFEYALASQIVNEKVTAIASCDAMGSAMEITRENVEKVVVERRADAVIATRLVAAGLTTEEGGGRDTRGSGQYKATDFGYENFYYGGWGAYGVPVTYGEFVSSPSITTLKGQVRVLTQVYSAADASLVFTGETVSKNLESGSALARMAEPIAKKLRREKIVPR
jgi:hypothetical protein